MGSYHKMDKYAREMAAFIGPTESEQEEDLAAKFAIYTERSEARHRNARRLYEDTKAKLDLANAANIGLLVELRRLRKALQLKG